MPRALAVFDGMYWKVTSYLHWKKKQSHLCTWAQWSGREAEAQYPHQKCLGLEVQMWGSFWIRGLWILEHLHRLVISALHVSDCKTFWISDFLSGRFNLHLQVQPSTLTPFWERSNSAGNNYFHPRHIFFLLSEQSLNTHDYLWSGLLYFPSKYCLQQLGDLVFDESGWGEILLSRSKILLLKLWWFMQVEFLIRLKKNSTWFHKKGFSSHILQGVFLLPQWFRQLIYWGHFSQQ